MTITARIVAHSIPSRGGMELISILCRYPRYIHPQILTHRVFSRNTASSRAIPVASRIKDVLTDPAIPVYWGQNQKGMQADTEITGGARNAAQAAWMRGMREAVRLAQELADLGTHKELANRVLEPYSHVECLITATDWCNFFQLRSVKAGAQHEIADLAQAIIMAIRESDPTRLHRHENHLPFVTVDEILQHGRHSPALARVSVARCARLSYLTHERGTPVRATWDQDMALANKLADSRHLSPFEHVATPLREDQEEIGNFHGWRQLRHAF